MALRSRLALAVFGTGLLSTVAYAPDAVSDALRKGNQSAAMPWMAGGVVLLMLLLGFAYRSNVHYRADERSDVGLVRERLGPRAGLVTGAALLVDYLFTVAVSVAAIAQFASYVVPWADGRELEIALGAIALMTLVSLRGIRDRARLMVAVWYGFLVVIALLFAIGLSRAGGIPDTTPPDSASAWTVVIAFAGAIASGGVMMTGIEHLASSGPYHSPPRARRAGRTLLVATFAAATAFFAVSWLAWHFRISGALEGPLLLQVTDAVFSSDAVLLIVGIASAAILYAAAAAVFKRFSVLSSLLAEDAYLPRQLAMRNDRMVFRGAVLIVAATSALVVIVTGARLEQLIHMYVIGVFASIVLSQAAMVRLMTAKIAREPDPSIVFRLRMTRVLHVSATAVAGAVWIVVAVFNFLNGAWVALALMAGAYFLMRGIRIHYGRVRDELTIHENDSASALPSATHGVVLVAQLHRPALRAIAYAKAQRHTSLKAIAVQVDLDVSRALQRQWGELRLGVPLVILESPYRDIIGPVMEYVKSVHRASPRDVVVFYVPEYIVGRWWERFLHNRATFRLRSLLLRTPGVIVAAVPWHLSSAEGDLDNLDRETDVRA